MKDGKLVIQKVFNAPPKDVFAAWTDPDTLAKWYGPVGTKNEIHRMDVREQGGYRLTMHTPDGGTHTLRGMFQAIEPPKKLVMTWQWETPPGEEEPPQSLVTVEFGETEGGKTAMTLTHQLPDEEAAKMHAQGWNSSFEDLEKLF